MNIRYFNDSQTMHGNSDVKVICDIPIYGVSQDYYNAYWEKQVGPYNTDGLTDDSVITHYRRVRESILRTAAWKYNQIVGYIRVSVGTQDVNFEEFFSFKRYQRDSNTKHFIEFNNDFHFYIGTLKTNEEIISRIKDFMETHIGDIKRTHPKFYVDTSAFDNIINHLDILSIITELGGSNK